MKETTMCAEKRKASALGWWVSLALSLAACKGNGDGEAGVLVVPPPSLPPAPQLELSLTSVDFDSEKAGGKSFGIVSNTEWSLGCTSHGDWCSVTPASGSGNTTVTVHVSENHGNADRHAFVRVAAGNLRKTVAVMQPYARPVVSGYGPHQAGAGASLTLWGNNFSPVPSENHVTLHGVPAEVFSSTPHEIKITVPSSILSTGLLRVTVAGNTATFAVPFTYLPRATVHTSAGNVQGSGHAQLSFPRGITVDGDGTLFVADTFNHRILKVTEGEVETLAGNNVAGHADGLGSQAQFSSPEGMAMDVQGNLYVADTQNHLIRKLTPWGEVSTLAGTTPGSGQAQLHSPRAIAVDTEGNLFVADSGNHRILKLTQAGVLSTLAGSGIAGVANGTGSQAQFHSPCAIAVDAEGNLYVVDEASHRIRKVTQAGVVSTLAGGAEGFAEGVGIAARFNSPSGIAVDAAGNLYVADSGNHRIRRVTPWGAVSTLAGRGTRGHEDGAGNVAQFHSPHGVALDAEGNLFVADSENHRVREITLE